MTMVQKILHKWSLVEEGKKFLIAIFTIAFIGMGSTVIMGMVAAQRQDDKIEALELCSQDLKSRVVELEKCKSNQVTKEDLKEFKSDIRLLIRMQGELNNTGREIKENTTEIKKNI